MIFFAGLPMKNVVHTTQQSAMLRTPPWQCRVRYVISGVIVVHLSLKPNKPEGPSGGCLLWENSVLFMLYLKTLLGRRSHNCICLPPGMGVQPALFLFQPALFSSWRHRPPLPRGLEGGCRGPIGPSSAAKNSSGAGAWQQQLRTLIPASWEVTPREVGSLSLLPPPTPSSLPPPFLAFGGMTRLQRPVPLTLMKRSRIPFYF